MERERKSRWVLVRARGVGDELKDWLWPILDTPDDESPDEGFADQWFKYV